MGIFTAVVIIFAVSYILARISNASVRGQRERLIREYERRRQKRIDALYGRDDDSR
jgi:hypothetical protein